MTTILYTSPSGRIETAPVFYLPADADAYAAHRRAAQPFERQWAFWFAVARALTVPLRTKAPAIYKAA